MSQFHRHDRAVSSARKQPAQLREAVVPLDTDRRHPLHRLGAERRGRSSAARSPGDGDVGRLADPHEPRQGQADGLPNSRILIHQPSGGFEGQSSDIEIHAREILDLRERLEAIYEAHTGQNRERIHDDMERDNFFDPGEAVKYGLIDRVIETHEIQRTPLGFGEDGGSG
jgi:hypothetical protein